MIATKEMTLMFRGKNYRHFDVCSRVPNADKNLDKQTFEKLVTRSWLIEEGSKEHKDLVAKIESEKAKEKADAKAAEKSAPSAAAKVLEKVKADKEKAEAKGAKSAPPAGDKVAADLKNQDKKGK